MHLFWMQKTQKSHILHSINFVHLLCLKPKNMCYLGSTPYLEDHPMTCKWLISPLSRVVPLPRGPNGLKMGVTNQLLTGKILRAPRMPVTTRIRKQFLGDRESRHKLFICDDCILGGPRKSSYNGMK